ncbi:PREDICTED: vomeronasal type-2 receptor 26-like, partial [Nanorana parkeri]|uniref:vomeronasal type-2 receptor 26-like n=1 Tax=Nanorana parkeri TaxID=125878 RepID=UPI000854293A
LANRPNTLHRMPSLPSTSMWHVRGQRRNMRRRRGVGVQVVSRRVMVLVMTPRSLCSESCLPGYQKLQHKGGQPCCHHCVPCPENEITDKYDMERCYKCPDNQWPNERRDTCIQRTIEFLSYGDTLGTSLMFMALLFCFGTIIMFGIFVKHKDTPIVKANNRTLSFILLISLILSFLCPLLFIGRPTKISCLLRQAVFGTVFSVAVSSVLAKTITVVLAFNVTRPNSINKCMMKQFSVFLLIICSSGQLVICVLWFVFSPPFPEYDAQVEVGKMILQCNEGSVTAFYIVIGYMGCLAVFSFIVAFLARKLPDTFNEAQYITFSILVFCSVWISFIPAYLSTKGKYMVAVEVFAILSSGAGLLGCIFLPKCYIILMRPELNVKATVAHKKTFR